MGKFVLRIEDTDRERSTPENVEAIMDVPGVDALYFGLFDLCLSLGLNPLQMPFPEIDAILANFIEGGAT